MTSADLRATELVARAPLHPMVMCFPITCFVGTLLTDIAYAQTAEMMWADFSSWLIAVGVVLGWLASIVGIIDLVGRRYVTAPVPAWVYAIGILVVMIVATFNMLVHTRDAWTSVVPWGLALSGITVVLLVFTTSIGWTALYRRNVVVIP